MSRDGTSGASRRLSIARPFSRAGQNILQERQEAAPTSGAGGAWARPGSNGGWWARTTSLRAEREERSKERVGPKTPPELAVRPAPGGAGEDGGGAGRPPRTHAGGGVGVGTREEKNVGPAPHQHPAPHPRPYPPPPAVADGGGGGRGGGGSAEGRLSPLEISKTGGVQTVDVSKTGGGVKIGRRGWASGGANKFFPRSQTMQDAAMDITRMVPDLEAARRTLLAAEKFKSSCYDPPEKGGGNKSGGSPNRIMPKLLGKGLLAFTL
ncbi:hypothetical protein T484DRAFT_1831835 [Baffinella frigidus]|nr:hypothetical protein T484DRAFT_1831835 [Cryptophyta sp. CCMP2293]